MDAKEISSALADIGVHHKEDLVKSVIQKLAQLPPENPGKFTVEWFWVPGRVEVMGKHTDYCGGDSILMTVDRGFLFACVKDKIEESSNNKSPTFTAQSFAYNNYVNETCGPVSNQVIQQYHENVGGLYNNNSNNDGNNMNLSLNNNDMNLSNGSFGTVGNYPLNINPLEAPASPRYEKVAMEAQYDFDPRNIITGPKKRSSLTIMENADMLIDRDTTPNYQQTNSANVSGSSEEVREASKSKKESSLLDPAYKISDDLLLGEDITISTKESGSKSSSISAENNSSLNNSNNAQNNNNFLNENNLNNNSMNNNSVNSNQFNYSNQPSSLRTGQNESLGNEFHEWDPDNEYYQMIARTNRNNPQYISNLDEQNLLNYGANNQELGDFNDNCQKRLYNSLENAENKDLNMEEEGRFRDSKAMNSKSSVNNKGKIQIHHVRVEKTYADEADDPASRSSSSSSSSSANPDENRSYMIEYHSDEFEYLPPGKIENAHEREGEMLSRKRKEKGDSLLGEGDEVEAAAHWSKYFEVTWDRLWKNFPDIDLFPGSGNMTIVFASDLPIASGMSSSSALVCASYLLVKSDELEDEMEYKGVIGDTLYSYLGCCENGQDFRITRRMMEEGIKNREESSFSVGEVDENNQPTNNNNGTTCNSTSSSALLNGGGNSSSSSSTTNHNKQLGDDEIVTNLEGTAGVGTFGGSEDHAAILGCEKNCLSHFSFCPTKFNEPVMEWNQDYCMVIASSGVTSEKSGAKMEDYNNAVVLSKRANECVVNWLQSIHDKEKDSATTDKKLLPDEDTINLIQKITTTLKQTESRSSPPTLNDLSNLLEEISKKSYLSQKYSRDDIFKGQDEKIKNRFSQFQEEMQCIKEFLTSYTSKDFNKLKSAVATSQKYSDNSLLNIVEETRFLPQKAEELVDSTANAKDQDELIATSAFGAGFGGSVYAIVKKDNATKFMREWKIAYLEKFPQHKDLCQFFIVDAPGTAAQSFLKLSRSITEYPSGSSRGAAFNSRPMMNNNYMNSSNNNSNNSNNAVRSGGIEHAD